MNKRQLIAWQIWIERQHGQAHDAWNSLRSRLPAAWQRAFGNYVSRRWMGGTERGWRAFAARIVFWVTLAVFRVLHGASK